MMNDMVKRDLNRDKKSLSKRKFYTKTLLCVRVRASITAEAALVVPIFLLFLVLFLGLFRIEQIELQVKQALSYTAMSMAGQDARWDPNRLFRTQLKEQGCEASYIQGGFAGMKLDESNSDASYVRLVVTYQIKLPVHLFGKESVLVTQSAVVRRWVGSSREEGTDNVWVYITPYGTAYHRTATCRYLDLSVWATTKGQIRTLRNKEHGKYYACKRCAKKSIPDAATVYVTDYGELYHKNLTCRNLKRTVYRVKRESVDVRMPCQKCYGSD